MSLLSLKFAFSLFMLLLTYIGSLAIKQPTTMPEILREYRMMFVRVPEGEKAVPDPKKLGLRSKLGGTPDWDQEGETPTCPECEEKMSFVAQIDSIEHDSKHNPHAIDALSDHQQYMFSDVGMLYVFCCFNCNTTASVMQFG